MSKSFWPVLAGAFMIGYIINAAKDLESPGIPFGAALVIATILAIVTIVWVHFLTKFSDWMDKKRDERKAEKARRERAKQWINM